MAEPRRAVLVRLKPEIARQLRVAAALADRSLSAEIASRLEQTAAPLAPAPEEIRP